MNFVSHFNISNGTYLKYGQILIFQTKLFIVMIHFSPTKTLLFADPPD